MSLIHPVAHRYAMAFRESLSKEQMIQAKADMELLGDMVKDKNLFFKMVDSPILETAKKDDLLSKSLQGKISPETLRFLHFLVAKERIFILGDICRAWTEWVSEGEGKAYVLVLTAADFSESEKKSMQAALDKKFGLVCQIEYRTQKDLLGGFQVIRLNRVWDHSLKTQLERIKQRLLKAA